MSQELQLELPIEDEDYYPFNGINAETGLPIWTAMSIDELASSISRKGPSACDESRALAGMAAEWMPLDFEKSGWGLIVPTGKRDHFRALLSPLIEVRAAQQKLSPDDVLILEHDGRVSGGAWLTRHKRLGGTINPRAVPFYLLCVGSPEDIPIAFTSRLSLEHAVGRLHLPSDAAYEAYASSIVQHEAKNSNSPARVSLFGTAHDGDVATHRALTNLMKPLADELTALPAEETLSKIAQKYQGREIGFSTHQFFKELATRENLLNCLKGKSDEKQLLFISCHGLGVSCEAANQLDIQGSLLCQEWTGGKPELDRHSVSALDLNELAPTVVFSLACYGMGTPRDDSFNPPGTPAQRLSNQSFFSKIPQRLLGLGSLAFIGHFDRAWDSSFYVRRGEVQINPYLNLCKLLLAGLPIGFAMVDIASRAAARAVDINEILTDPNMIGRERELSTYWVEYMDARNYILFGDPAVIL